MQLRMFVVWLGGILLATVPLHVATAAESEKTPVLTILERTAEPLLKNDRPWEDRGVGYCQALKVGEQWHLWYSSYDHEYQNDNDSYLCYARSKDGVHWEKPSLGVYSYHGSTKNNVLGSGTHGVSIFLDQQAPPAERFKAVGVRQQGGSSQWRLFGATSSDGIRWTRLEEPLLKKNSDTQNTCLHDGNVYRLYVRMWSGGDFNGYRIVGYTESAKFGQFPDPVVILRPDKDDQSDMHFYNSATTKLNDHLYLMFPSGFFEKNGTVIPYAAFSRDGKRFQRLGHAPLLGLGKGFDSKGIYVAPGAIPGEKPGTYLVYYYGTSKPHDESGLSKHYDNGIGRFLLSVVD
jgi:hypothetical protein